MRPAKVNTPDCDKLHFLYIRLSYVLYIRKMYEIVVYPFFSQRDSMNSQIQFSRRELSLFGFHYRAGILRVDFDFCLKAFSPTRVCAMPFDIGASSLIPIYIYTRVKGRKRERKKKRSISGEKASL